MCIRFVSTETRLTDIFQCNRIVGYIQVSRRSQRPQPGNPSMTGASKLHNTISTGDGYTLVLRLLTCNCSLSDSSASTMYDRAVVAGV